MKTIQLLLGLCLLLIGCDQLGKEQTEESTKEKFHWNFEEEKVYVYSYEVITYSISQWSDFEEQPDTTTITTKGILKVKSKGNGKANVVLEILEMQSDFLKREESDSMRTKRPKQTIVLQGMDVNSQFESKNPGSNLLIDFLFPLPTYDLKAGHREKQNAAIPFNLMGSPLEVKGYQELHYKGNALEEPSSWAILNNTIKVDQLDVPEEIKGEFSFTMNGMAAYTFDFQNKHFISSEVELDGVMDSKFDPSESSLGARDMFMKSTNTMKVKFIEIED